MVEHQESRRDRAEGSHQREERDGKGEAKFDPPDAAQACELRAHIAGQRLRQQVELSKRDQAKAWGEPEPDGDGHAKGKQVGQWRQ